ncbi:MAG TPA: hypothetical protein PLT92_03165 [Ignavibacteriaceae bacterium]|nr:hypothetical protein [Ignavibacteriaceae bacterium]
MFKLRSILILILMAVFFIPFIGCKKPPKPKTPESLISEELRQDSVQQKPTRGKIPNKYGVKSGYIESEIKNNILNVPITGKIYFDKYGDLEMSEEISEMEVMGQKIKTHTRKIVKDGFISSIDMIKKTGNKIKINSIQDLNSFDFSKYSKEMLANWQISELPDEIVLNKKCKVTSFESGKMKGTVWTWEGITLKLILVTAGMEFESRATKLETNIPIKRDLFEIPQDVKIF